MKKIIALEFDKCSQNGLNRDKCLKTITNKFHRSFKELGEFIIQQIFKGNELPKRLEIYMEIWRGEPLKRGARVTVGKHTMDNLKKCHRYQVISKMFIDAFGAMGHFCMNNIRQRKRLPGKVVIEVEVK